MDVLITLRITPLILEIINPQVILVSFRRNLKITLANTRVLECKRALTGPGLSMALKSQGKNTNCADLDEKPIKIRKEFMLVSKKLEPKTTINKQMSPIRLDSSLTKAKEFAKFRLFHQLTSRYELILKTSQKIKNINLT